MVQQQATNKATKNINSLVFLPVIYKKHTPSMSFEYQLMSLTLGQWCPKLASTHLSSRIRPTQGPQTPGDLLRHPATQTLTVVKKHVVPNVGCFKTHGFYKAFVGWQTMRSFPTWPGAQSFLPPELPGMPTPWEATLKPSDERRSPGTSRLLRRGWQQKGLVVVSLVFLDSNLFKCC